MKHGPVVSFDALVGTFNRQVADLKRLALLRSDAAGAHDFAELETVVAAVELQLQQVQQAVRREAAAIPKAHAMIPALQQQQRALQHIGSNLPARLPSAPPSESLKAAASGKENATTPARASALGDNTAAAAGPVPALAAKAATPRPPSAGLARAAPPATKKASKSLGPAPKTYVTVSELAEVSSYMKGRLSLDRINAAVDEAAAFADANARLLQQLQAKNRNKVGEADMQRMQLLKEISTSEEAKGQHIFLESDMKTGTSLKLDNTGKQILTVLRHLGRLSEVRMNLSRGGLMRVFLLL